MRLITSVEGYDSDIIIKRCSPSTAHMKEGVEVMANSIKTWIKEVREVGEETVEKSFNQSEVSFGWTCTPHLIRRAKEFARGPMSFPGKAASTYQPCLRSMNLL